MIKLTQIKLPLNHRPEELEREIARILRIKAEDIQEYEIRKRSLDARKKDQLHYSYVVLVRVAEEEKICRRIHNPAIAQVVQEQEYQIPETGESKLTSRPVVVGSGPAGLYAAWLLAQKGFRPIVVERGASVEKRTQIVEHFWQSGELSERTNVQFGEGGAGTFSDGKLNTMVKDTFGRIRYMLKGFVRFGADPAILYLNKPHIGTDVLRDVVRNMREEICTLGGEFHFETQLIGLQFQDHRLKSVVLQTAEGKKVELAAEVLVLAIGHSARDTFYMLQDTPLVMEAKPFAVGVRVEHLQETIDRSQYGQSGKKLGLPAADYKVTHTSQNGRGVYSFCMCPGGYVVNASSEQKRLVVNGMSNHARDGRNANSALIVTVTPEDFRQTDEPGGQKVLSGIEFQRRLEEAAYGLAEGKVPVQLYGDFRENRVSTGYGRVRPDIKGAHELTNLREILPGWLSESLIEGMTVFGHKIRGFSEEEAIFSGVETRTSSPVRLLRQEETLEAVGVTGIYPCGEGAGYAGGITSAAVDGIKVAEAIIQRYRPC